MTKRIFGSIALVAALVFIASVVLIMGVLYTHFLNVQMDQMKAQAELAAQGVSKSGETYMKGLEPEGYRITWIGSKGDVLYDSAADPESMENHLQREEVQEALKSGEGESTRYSTTLLERRLYVAVKAEDESFVRISDAQRSVLGLLLGMLQQILIIAVVALALSVLLAYSLTKRIVKPLNEIDLERPEDAKIYDEMKPLVERIQIQQNQIRNQSQQLLRKQQEFEAATANMEEGLLILNSRREVLTVNRSAADILSMPNYPRGKELGELNVAPEIESAFERAASGRKTEVGMEHDGRQFELHASPVRAGEAIEGVVIFIIDISGKLREEQMRREFTANVSHELKTPLQTISGSAELMAEGMVRQEDVADFGRKIHHEASRLITLIEDIIGLSKLDEGCEDMRSEEVDMFAVAEKAVAELSYLAAKSEIDLNLSGESAMVMGDATLLESIVHNLCENGIKYGKPQGFVNIDVSDEAQEVVLTVSDNGIGIPQEEQERIFERFYRVDKGRSKETGGTGLGLSIVKHAVRIHKGRVELESHPGEGTTVKVILPSASKQSL